MTSMDMYEQFRTFVTRELASSERGLARRVIAYHAVKEAILRGILKPTEPLIEERLAAALGLSRTPVRESLIMLAHEGLLALLTSGLYVNTISSDEFEQMSTTVEVVETAIVGQAARRATDADIQALEDALKDAERHIYDLPLHLAACRRFAQRLGQIAGDEYTILTKTLLNVVERSDVYLIGTDTSVPVEKLRGSIADRRAFLEAIRAHDVVAAAAAAHAHGIAIRQRWQDLMVTR